MTRMENQIQKLEKALSKLNVVACVCCGEYYPSKDRAMLNTTKGPICLSCVTDNEDALEDCTLPHRDLCIAFWDAYKPFLSCATVDGKRYLSGAPIDPSKGIRERDNRDLAIILWDYADSQGLKLPSHGGFLPKYDPSKFKVDGGVWVYNGNS